MQWAVAADWMRNSKIMTSIDTHPDSSPPFDVRGLPADHRGRPFCFCHPLSLPPGTPAQVASAHKKAFWAPKRRTNIIGSAVLLAGILIVLHLVGLELAFLIMFGAITVGLMVFGQIRESKRGNPVAAAAIEACISHEICPSCGRSLRSAAAGEDRCRACAYCGSAWRMAQPPQRGTGGEAAWAHPPTTPGPLGGVGRGSPAR
jgi:hypothetical protein